MSCKVKVLGSTYRIADEPLERGTCGECDHESRRIRVDISQIKEEHGSSWKRELKHVMRHEIIHAFLYESGLSGYDSWEGSLYHNELLVDWLATQTPKMLKAFEAAGCL